MDTRTSAIWIVAPLLLVMVFSSAGFSNPVHTYGNSFNLPIPANPSDTKGWMADAIVEVPLHLVISDLNVRLTLTHGSLFDLQIFLQSPAGTTVSLNPAGNTAFIVRGEDGRLHAWGGSVDWTFDDQAGTSIEQAAAPFVGSFRPAESLNAFDGQDAFGSWHLQICDAFVPDTGSFNHLDLMITAPEPATFFLLALGVLFCERRATSHERRV